jgi:hypothetical protein
MPSRLLWQVMADAYEPPRYNPDGTVTPMKPIPTVRIQGKRQTLVSGQYLSS